MTIRRPQYQRNTSTTGRVVDTGPPRTSTGLTGLGAVGGPTGVGAGALRVIVEFLTQYDSKELKQLEGELARLQKVEDRHNTRTAALQKQEAQSQGAITRLRNIQQRFDLNTTKAQQKEITKIRDLERSRARGAKAQADAAKTLLAQQTGFRKAEISQLINADRIESKSRERRAALAASVARSEERAAKAQQAQVGIQQRVGRLQQLRANLAPKLGSLALGAVGGIFGGAVVGLGFAAAQALIDAVGESLTNLFDPANKAREGLAGVAEQINKIAQKEGITLLEAAKRQIRELGIEAAGVDPKMLAAAAATAAYIEKNEELAKILEVIRHQEQLTQEAVAKRASILAEQAGLGPAGSETNFRVLARGNLSPEDIFGPQNAARAVEIYNQALAELETESTAAASAQASLANQERGAAQAAAIASIAQDRLVNTLQRLSGLRITGLQDQLSAIGDTGPSARTLQLQSQLDGLAESQAQAAHAATIAGIQEERALVLLEQRIKFQGQSVKLDQLSARGQIVAIDARISALQRAGEAERDRLDALNESIELQRRADREQDKRDAAALKVYDEQIEALRKRSEEQSRFNQLLDLQFRLGQIIRRNEGESIADFISRRANETRQLLEERESLQREGQIDVIQTQRDELAGIQEVANERREAAIEARELEAQQLQDQLERIDKARQAEISALNDRKDQLQLQARLEELAEQERRANAAETARKRAKYLQDELKASQEADEAATKSRQQAINEQIEAEQKKLDRLLYYTNVENLTRLEQAVAGARTYGDLNAISGEIAGAKRVLGELRALVAAGVLPASMVSERIANLVTIIRAADAKLGSIVGSMPRPTTPGGRPSGRIPFQHGGAFLLSNSMNNPFHANIQAGEGGQEIGVVLSNRVAKILQEQQRSNTPANMPVTINRSDDPWADRQRARRLIREIVREELGR